jgi:hypothetical protein
MVLELEKPSENIVDLPVIPPSKCPKCGGNIEIETREKRWHCLNCGAGKYYGLPKHPIQLVSYFLPLATIPQRKKYQPTRPGAIITLGHGTSHFVDTGCQRAPRCLDCPLLFCPEDNV